MNTTLLTYLGVFAALSFGLKMLLLSLVAIHRLRNGHYLALLVFLAVQNAAEASGYFVLADHPELASLAVDFYMVALYFIAASIICIGLGKLSDLPRIAPFAYFLAGAVSVLHMTGWLVEGYHFQGYALVRIRAELFFVADAFLICAAVVGACAPYCIGSRRISDFAIAGFSLTLLSVVVLQLFSIEATTAVVQPVFAIALSVSLLLEAKSRRALRLQGTIYRTVAGVRTINSNLPLAEKMRLLEAQQITAAMMIAENVQRDAANDLGVARSTISKKVASRAASAETGVA